MERGERKRFFKHGWSGFAIGATSGAVAGSVVLPGIGTVIGAAIGAACGKTTAYGLLFAKLDAARKKSHPHETSSERAKAISRIISEEGKEE